MKLIANENFQFRGLHRAGVTLTVPAALLLSEIEKGRHLEEKKGRHPWMSGLLEHCTPANQATADFIEEKSGAKIDPIDAAHDESDDSDEIREIRAEFDAMGKAYDKRWKVETLRNRLVEAKKEFGARRHEQVKTAQISES